MGSYKTKDIQCAGKQDPAGGMKQSPGPLRKILTEKEEKRVIYYCIAPGLGFKVMTGLACFVFLCIPLEVIFGVRYSGDHIWPHYEVDFLLVCLVIYSVFFFYSVLSVATGIKGKKWKAIEERVNEALAYPEYVEAAQAMLPKKYAKPGRWRDFFWEDIERGDGTYREQRNNAVAVLMAEPEFVAKLFRARVPDTRKILIRIFAVTLAAMLGTYAAGVIRAESIVRARFEDATQNKDKIVKCLEQCGGRIDVEEKKNKSESYDITCWVNDMEVLLSLDLDEYGIVEHVYFSAELDKELPGKEDLEKAENYLKLFNSALENIDRSIVRVPGLTADFEIPEKIKREFPDSTQEKDIEADRSNEEIYENWEYKVKKGKYGYEKISVYRSANM